MPNRQFSFSTLLFFALLLGYTPIYAQTIPIERILESALTDDKLIKNQRVATFAQGLNYKMPLLKKIDIRLGINGNGTRDTIDGYLRNEDYYALSITTNNFKEMRLQRALKPAQIEVYSAEQKVFLQQALLERYQSVVTVFYSKKLYDERSLFKNLLDKKTEVLRKSLEQGLDIRVKDVMDTENDKNALASILLDYENNRTFQMQRIQQFLKTKETITLDVQDFITPSQIEIVVKTMQADTNLAHPMFAYRRAQTAYSAADNALENAQNRQILSFVQLGYTNPIYDEGNLKRFNPQNNIAFRVGLTVPLPANNNLKRSETALQLQEDTQTELLMQQLQKKLIEVQYIKLDNIFKSLRLNEKNTNESLIKKMLNNEKLLTQLTALEVLDLQIAQKKLDVRSLELSSDLTNEYLRLLELTGAIGREANRNFLK
jgi:hypothetical protein